MASLAEFVTQIGAASVPSKLVLPEPGAVPPLAALHARIESEIRAVNEQTQQLLQHHWPEFESQLSRGTELLDRVSREEELVAALEDEMTGKNAFVPALLEQLAAHSTLARAHCESAHTLSSLTTLTTLHSSVATLSSDVTSGALPRAVAALGIVRRQLEGDVEGWIKATEAWSALSKWASEEGARLEGALVGAVDGCFCFETTGEGAKLTLSSAITAAPRGESLSISTLLASLDKVLEASDPPKRIDVHLARIAKQLHRFFLQPFIESNGGDGGSREELVYGTQEQAQTVVRRPVGLHAAREPLVAVRQFLEFFATHSTLLPSSPFGAIFAANFTPPLQDLLIAHHLVPLLPLETSHLGSYLATLASAAAFEKEFLVKAGYLCFLPAGEEATRDEGRVVQDWIARVDVHWSRHLGSAALDQVRGEVATNDWKGELVEIEILEDDDEVMKEVAVLPLEESEEEEEVTDDEFELLDSASHSMSTTPTPSTIALPPPVEPAPLSPPKPTGRKAKLVATKITPAPALPPPASTAVPATTPAALPEMLEEEDPWGLSTSPAEVSSVLTSPTETSFPSAIAAPIPFPQLAPPISVMPPSSVKSNGLTPPIRSRVNSSASVGSEMDDPWGLEGVELDLDETSEQGAEVVEEEGDDAWGFGVDEGEESEPKPVPVPVAAPRPASIGRPYSPAVAILPQSSLAVPARPSHAKQESLGNWGWEHDDQAELLAGPAAEDEVEREPVPVAPVPVSPVLVTPVAPVVVAPFPVEPVAPTPVALVPVPVTIPKVKKMRKVKKLRVAIPPIVKPKAEPTKRSEKILISTRSRAIVKIADGVLSSALEVISPSFVHPAFSKSSASLIRSFISILSLYRATAPVQHAKVLSEVPAIAMQFANDAEWIGDEVERSKLKLGTQLDSKAAAELDGGIKRLRAMAAEQREVQVSLQNAALMECLDEANLFLRTAEDVKYATCQRAIRQVTHVLHRLAAVWEPVMNPTAFYATLGALVNSVLLRVLTEIEDQEDISEEESIRLNKLCKSLHELETLFVGDNGSSAVGREVPIWFKFVFLSELLEASMADILFLFDNSHLVDFTTHEIVKLVRALFSDSPLRVKNIEHILKGRPDVPLGDDDVEGWN